MKLPGKEICIYYVHYVNIIYVLTMSGDHSLLFFIFLQVVFLALAISMQSAQGKYLDMTWVMDMDHISYFPLFGSDEYRFQFLIISSNAP